MNTVLLKDGLQGIGVSVEESGISARVIISEIKTLIVPQDYIQGTLDVFDEKMEEIFGVDTSIVQWNWSDYIYTIFTPAGIVSFWYYLITLGYHDIGSHTDTMSLVSLNSQAL